jgi:energy-coupling factor transporter ATP-binding protein EcfA2
MVDGEAWTGITKVYRVLQKTSCAPNYSSDGHYTILKLKRLLTVNRLINLKELLASIDKPHLLLIAWGNNQPVNDEIRDMFRELFDIMKQKKNTKIILTTHSEDNTAAFLEQIVRETLGECFIKTDEKLRWSDLAASSQTEILEKTVIFQGRRVALNQLTSAESITDSFPLAELLQEKELNIGENRVPSSCSGYNKKYYIDRTFNHNIIIRQDISTDRRQYKFFDLLASTELEFKQLCQQNPKENVHWLQKEKSGELIWQQSQGSLKKLREYIDSRKTHSCAPSDLVNLSEQAKHQRVMIIADRAGMGKSTILTHLSEGMKQEFPAHWLVRIDLNDYTVLLEAQKGKQMDKENLLELVSKEVLKLESPLEKELFKKSFKKKWS